MKHALLLPLILVACGAQPAPEFLHATRVDVTRDGRQYTVYHTEKRVEVIRLGYAARGEYQAIRATMIGLIPQVTGCKLLERSLQGDSGEMRGSIRC
jgi:ABC-type Fe3+-citrate transport system substrate-binding protein